MYVKYERAIEKKRGFGRVFYENNFITHTKEYIYIYIGVHDWWQGQEMLENLFHKLALA